MGGCPWKTKQTEKVISSIEKSFIKQVQKGQKLKKCIFTCTFRKERYPFKYRRRSNECKSASIHGKRRKNIYFRFDSMLYENGQLSFEDGITNI